MNKHKGFTLVETMLYLAIMSVLLGAVSSYVYVMVRAEFRHREASLLFQDADRLHRLLVNDIRVASGVLHPTFFSTSSTLTLQHTASTTITYEFASSGIWRSGTNLSPERITSAETTVREFSTQYTATSSSRGVVGFTASFLRRDMLSNDNQQSLYTIKSAVALRP